MKRPTSAWACPTSTGARPTSRPSPRPATAQWTQLLELDAPDWADINNPDTSAVGFEKGEGLSADAAAKLDEFIKALAGGLNLWKGPLNLQDGTSLPGRRREATAQQIWYLPQLLEGMEGQSVAEVELVTHSTIDRAKGETAPVSPFWFSNRTLRTDSGSPAQTTSTSTSAPSRPTTASTLSCPPAPSRASWARTGPARAR